MNSSFVKRPAGAAESALLAQYERDLRVLPPTSAPFATHDGRRDPMMAAAAAQEAEKEELWRKLQAEQRAMASGISAGGPGSMRPPPSYPGPGHFQSYPGPGPGPGYPGYATMPASPGFPQSGNGGGWASAPAGVNQMVPGMMASYPMGSHAPFSTSGSLPAPPSPAMSGHFNPMASAMSGQFNPMASQAPAAGVQTLPPQLQGKVSPAGAGMMPTSVPQVMQRAQQMAAEAPFLPQDVWYPAQHNWVACEEAMREKYKQVLEEFNGEEYDEEREVAATQAEEVQDKLFNKSGGRFGKKHVPKKRMAHVINIFHDEDEHFPGERIPLWYRAGQVQDFHALKPPAMWRRLQDFTLDTPYPQRDVASGAFNPHGGRVYQGALEDFYLVAGMQAVGMKPELLRDMFFNMECSNPKMGVFTLRLYKHGQWQHVQIDDELPFDKDDNPLCCTSEFFPGWSWPSLVEKAYAKLHESWEGLGGGGHIEEVMTDLTGGCSTRFGTTDVAIDRLWMYLHEMQRWAIFACNINEFECTKRSVPIEGHWAASIWRVERYEGIPYVCVCLAAPAATIRHLPVCDVPSTDGFEEVTYGAENGFAWLRIDDFVTFFDTVYECRLVNSALGPLPALSHPINIHGISCLPGYVPSTPWFEELWAIAAPVGTANAPSFLIEVTENNAPVEITLEVSQSDKRCTSPHEEKQLGRDLQAPLLLRFYQCSREVDDRGGGEIYLVHLSAWGHCRDACCGVKVMKPGKYLAMVSIPASYECSRMIFRTYSTRPIAMKPITQHRSWIAVNPARPLDAMPYSLAGFQRVDSYSEKLPQMFDEAEGRGKPMANCRDIKRGRPVHDGTGGLKVVGKFGGRDAVATVNASETQDGCTIA